MEKNKNRTDLLAAGRKKLQQYRQKKDGKGGKSSSKANKSDRDVVDDEASSVAKPAKGKKQLPDTEGPAQGSAAELVDSSLQGSTDNLVTTSNLPIEVSGTDEGGSSPRLTNESIDVPVQNEDLQSSNLDNEIANTSSEAIEVDGNYESGYMAVMPVGLKAVLDDASAHKAGDLKAAHGEDQVPDEPDHSSSEPDNRTSLMDLEVDMNPASFKVDENAQVDSRFVEEYTKMEHTSSATEQTSEQDDSGAINADSPPVSPRFLPISDGFQSSNPEPTIHPKDVVAGFHGDEGRTPPPSSGDSEDASPEGGLISGGSVTSRIVKNDVLLKFGSAEFSDRLKEQLYINNLEKELIYLQLCQQQDLQKELDHHHLQWANDKSAFSASLNNVERKNKILSEELAGCRSELGRFSARIEELQIELDRSEHQLSDVSSELVYCRGLLSDLKVKNENLNEEKDKLEKEKGDWVLENEKLSKELMECNSLLEMLKVENVNVKGSFDLVMEEKTNLEEEKQKYVRENDNLVNELVEWKKSVKAFQVENAELKGNLEEANERFVEENKKLCMELLESQRLVESLRSESVILNGNLDHLNFEKEECLTELATSQILTKRLEEDYHKTMNDLKESSLRLEQLTEENVTLTSTLDVYKAKIMEFDEWKMKSEQRPIQERAISHPTLKDDYLEPDLFKDSSGFVAFKVEKVMRELDKAIEAMRFLSVSGGKAVASGVSKLVQSFELKGRLDESEEIALREDSEAYVTAKEKMGNLKDLFKGLVHFEALQEQSNILEETFVKHVVLDEFMKQYACIVEGKKHELVGLYEDLRQEETVTKAKNSELIGKLSNSESSIYELHVQMDELHQRLDDMASLNNQLETLHGKLDGAIGTVFATHSTETGVDQNIGTRLATSVDAAVALIQDLQGKLDDAHRNHKDMNVKTKDLEAKNDMAVDVLHKVYHNLHKLVNVSGPHSEESQDDIRHDKLLDPLDISNYDDLIERLRMLIGEQGQLESMNGENLELLERIKDMEELNRRRVNPDVIVKLLQDIESEVKLDDIEINPFEPVSSLESIIHFLIKKSIGLQNQIDQLSLSIIQYENESDVFKESLRTAMDQLITYQSETNLKETELQQCEQRVSALREKLHIAVTKGKGLISQRDSLKQSLTATSGELEKCLHELQLKDAALQETETKLKTYSEAGERMEALESELSYIRNSATALRESFLSKDSVLQRIEEILEDLELPEHFHAGDTIEKIDWLARSVSQNSFSVSNLNQGGSTGSGSYPDHVSSDLEPASIPGDELRRNYEELQSKFYGLAEQNEMLERSLMERNTLVQRWEEVLDKINMPPQLRSVEPEDRIEWLRGALSEANGRCEILEQDIYSLENTHESLTADHEDAQRRLVDLEVALQSVTNEREQLSASLEVKNHDYDKAFEKASLYEIENNKLMNEISGLRLRLDEKRVDEEAEGYLMQLKEERDEHVEKNRSLVQEIEALEGKNQFLVQEIEALKAALQSITNEREQLSASLKVKSHDYDKVFEKASLYEIENDKLTNEIAGLQLRLNEKCVDEEAEGDLIRLKEERDEHVEKNRSLVEGIEALEGKNRSLGQEIEALDGKSRSLVQEVEALEGKNRSLGQEIEALEGKNQELQKLLTQEEQKSAGVREKLNIAVRKGKSLVQQRDGLKQSINDMTSEVERLNSEIKFRENTILEYEQKVKDLITLQERMEDKDSKIGFLRNRLAEVDRELQDKNNTFSMILGALGKIDLGAELRTNDPVEKLEQIEKLWRDFQEAVSASEQESRKSKRAAELLLAELNEVQERNEDLLEELSKTTMEISELSKERDSAEAAKQECLERLERLAAIYSEERGSQFSELTVLKSGLDQLRPGFIGIYNLVNDVLPKELEGLYNLEASMKSLLESVYASNVSGQTLKSSSGGIISRPETKVNVMRSQSFVDRKMEEQFNENNIIELWRFLGSHMQDLVSSISDFEEKLQSHSKCLHEEVFLLSETVATLRREMTSDKYSLESAKEEIARLESTGKQKETENSVLHRYISILYEACKNSVIEIEKSKTQLVANDSNAEDMSYALKSSPSEEHITSMVNKLLSYVKDIHSVQSESLEVNQKELKDTISSLQKELTEKDIQKDRICLDLVSQIKQAEAAAMSNLQELEQAKDQIHDLRGRLEAVNLQRDELEERVKELEGQESILVDLREKVKSLTDALTAKEQEAEALLQALDEEEAQMEDLTNKITEFERLVQQKDLDLESVEASRGKALKKLSVTVSKFDELHHLSETLLSEIDKLQSQLQERDSEISFLRDEITRCTSDSLLALKTDKKGLDEFQEILTWLDSKISGVKAHDLHLDDNKIDQVNDYKYIIQKKITPIISEVEELRQVTQIKDDQLQIERRKVEDLTRERELLEGSLRESQSRLSIHQNVGDPAQTTSTSSEIVEVEPMVNKWSVQGTSVAPQVRSLRKVNNEQLAISIDDVDSDNRDKLEDEDDDKAHGFKSLTTSKLVPRFTRPVTNFIDGLWVSCDRTLMRQPILRLSLIIYWALMHALLATFVV